MYDKFFQKLFSISIILMISLSISLIASKKIRISITPSAGAHFFIVKKYCSYKRGEIVEVKTFPEEKYIIDAGKVTLVKHIGCLPGEYIINLHKNFYCYFPGKVNLFLGKALNKTHTGKPLTAWDPSSSIKTSIKILFGDRIVRAYKIPPLKFFLYNSHPRSYDSRYLGLIDKKNIIDCLKPIF